LDLMQEHPLKFLVDQMLGKLAKYLRMLGIDAVYFPQTDVSLLIEKAYQEKRTILSRNTKLKHIDGLSDFVFISNDQPDKQLSEMLNYFKIHISHDQLFTRCLTCNQKLVFANHEDVKGKVPSYVFGIQKKFSLCPQCKKVYWEGTHSKKMKEIIWKVVEKNGPSTDFIGA
jgi:uncharacterized protein with PIN domain